MKNSLSKVNQDEVFAFGWDVEFQCIDTNSGLPTYPEIDDQGNFTVFRDYAASEIASSREEYDREKQRELITMAKIRLLGSPDFNPYFHDILRFSPEVWKNMPPEFRAMGCRPDENLYGLSTNKDKFDDVPMRSCGGHIHIGVRNGISGGSVYVDMLNNNLLVKNLDKLLAIFNTVYNRRNQKLRREIYGQPGTFRTKEYGLEYRTLDNSWWPITEICDFNLTLLQIALDYTCNETEVSGSENYVDIILEDNPKAALESILTSIGKFKIPFDRKKKMKAFVRFFEDHPITTSFISPNNQTWEALPL